MRTRLRYYVLMHNLEHFDIADKMNLHRYTEEQGRGFDILESTKTRTVSKFIERKTLQEENLLPDGTIESLTRTVYSIFEFELFEIKPSLSIVRILNSPLSLKTFVNSFAEIFEGFSISKILFDPSDMYKYISSHKNVARYEVPRVLASQIPYSEKAVAAIDLRSSANALTDLKKVHEKGSFKLDKLFMKIRLDGTNCELEVSTSGAITCNSRLINLIDDLVVESRK